MWFRWESIFLNFLRKSKRQKKKKKNILLQHRRIKDIFSVLNGIKGEAPRGFFVSMSEKGKGGESWRLCMFLSDSQSLLMHVRSCFCCFLFSVPTPCLFCVPVHEVFLEDVHSSTTYTSSLYTVFSYLQALQQFNQPAHSSHCGSPLSFQAPCLPFMENFNYTDVPENQCSQVMQHFAVLPCCWLLSCQPIGLRVKQPGILLWIPKSSDRSLFYLFFIKLLVLSHLNDRRNSK